MNKLKIKIFISLFSLVSVSLVLIFIIFNASLYNNEYLKIKDRFIKVSTIKEGFDIGIEKSNPIIMSEDIYVLFYDRDGIYEGNASISQDTLTEKELLNLVIINKKKIESGQIGNLYLSDYVFKINKSHNLIIINNNSNRLFLLFELRLTCILFIASETLATYLIYLITNWIVKPVYTAFEKQKQFIGDASHELKTPLAIISASCETLESDPENKKWLNNIEEESERMNKLVLQLLELSKSENVSNLVLSKINLSKLVEKKAISFESLMYENKYKLVMDIKPDIDFVCDEERIKELIGILLDNAIKYGKTNTNIEVVLYKEKNNIILKIINEGKQIPPEEEEKIFERFYRIDKSRNRKDNNYGLGLSIAKNIVINHKGTIKAFSNNGKTTFQINFKQ